MFRGKDRWGRSIAFDQHRWDQHVRLQRGRFQEKGAFNLVMKSFQESPLVIDNPPAEEYGPRVGAERYVSVPIPEWNNSYLIVPVIRQETPLQFQHDGEIGALPPPVYIGWTAYLSDDIPSGEVVLQWPLES